ncbi:hypothetical protein [Falsiroseomonas sp. E2-1-a20]|uniref:hypothetical protein n=1 Tax=Falsiroseomonas sp. E2-1-a20 TaxID=3239300 RepID=UPI003F369776
MPDTNLAALDPSNGNLLAGSVTAATGDSEVVRLAEKFIADEEAKELKLVHFCDMVRPWSAADHREIETYSASATGYHERMAAITQAHVTTPAGLLAQAQVLLWHSRHPSGDEVHLWNLANGVFRVLGEPLPAWVAELAEEPQE